MPKTRTQEVKEEQARDIAASVLYHLEQMYPMAWAAMSGSCRRSLRNTIKSTFRVHVDYVTREVVEAAAVEAENYPRTSSMGKPLSGLAIAAVIRKLKL